MQRDNALGNGQRLAYPLSKKPHRLLRATIAARAREREREGTPIELGKGHQEVPETWGLEEER